LNIAETHVAWYNNFTIKVLVEDTTVYPKTQYFQSQYM